MVGIVIVGLEIISLHTNSRATCKVDDLYPILHVTFFFYQWQLKITVSYSRLENLIKEYKQALKTSEEEVEQLQRRVSSPAPTPLSMTTPSSYATPTRLSPPRSPSVDTPSKDVVLDPEPHGAEFEVNFIF